MKLWRVCSRLHSTAQTVVPTFESGDDHRLSSWPVALSLGEKKSCGECRAHIVGTHWMNFWLVVWILSFHTMGGGVETSWNHQPDLHGWVLKFIALMDEWMDRWGLTTKTNGCVMMWFLYNQTVWTWWGKYLASSKRLHNYGKSLCY